MDMMVPLAQSDAKEVMVVVDFSISSNTARLSRI